MNNKTAKKLLLFIPAAFVLLLYNTTGVGCPIRYVLNIPCPTCGMTRALFSLLKLDFSSYFLYNPMALPLAAVILLQIYAHKHTRFKKIINAVTIVTALLIFIVYIIRLYYSIIP